MKNKKDKEVVFDQLFDFEWFQIANIEDFKLECCDCSLVHDVSWKIKGKKLLMRVAQNKKLTKKARKEKQNYVVRFK